MALKGDRHILYDSIQFFCSDVAERGVILVFSGSGASGVDLNNTSALVTLPGTGSVSGLKAAGLLLNDIVDVDLTKYKLNQFKDEVKIGGKVWLLKKGYVYTNKLKSGDTPGQGDTAYLAPSGEISTTSTNAAVVGKFVGKKDQNGYVQVEIDLP